MTIAATNSWLAPRRPNSRARVRLFCFPYAGGSEAIYRTWRQTLPEAVEVLPVQLPGRGTRIKEPALTRVAPLVQALSQSLRPEMELPFAFFGHSMGGLIAFELARQLRREGGPLPVHLFISAKSSPKQVDERESNLSDEELIERLRRYEGTPTEVLENAEIMQLLLPLIRADIELCDTYACDPEPPLPCPITAFGGLQDPRCGRENLEAWQDYTTGRFTLRMFPAGHFFLRTWEKSILESIFRDLAPHTASS
ncbi:MAG TPA: thioesterase II family protein [Candidatus Angelobacter sp.]|nr:thioesterase II family protein [Candidatus Angelobacter sp.]